MKQRRYNTNGRRELSWRGRERYKRIYDYGMIVAKDAKRMRGLDMGMGRRKGASSESKRLEGTRARARARDNNCGWVSWM